MAGLSSQRIACYRRARLLVAVAVAVGLTGCVAPPAAPSADGRGPVTDPMSASQLGQTDFNRTVSVAMRDNLDALYALAEKLYRRNPAQWRLSGASGVDDAVARIRRDVLAGAPPAGLGSLRDVQVLGVALNPDYTGDRVAAFVYGLADTLIAAHNGKAVLYATDVLDAQRVYNAARNVEVAAWMLATRRDAQGAPLLLANTVSDDAVNLSFERLFGAIMGRVDLVANLLGENNRRIGIGYAQGLMLFNFLPVR